MSKRAPSQPRSRRPWRTNGKHSSQEGPNADELRAPRSFRAGYIRGLKRSAASPARPPCWPQVRFIAAIPVPTRSTCSVRRGHARHDQGGGEPVADQGRLHPDCVPAKEGADFAAETRRSRAVRRSPASLRPSSAKGDYSVTKSDVDRSKGVPEVRRSRSELPDIQRGN